MESWRIHVLPPGAHTADPEARFYDPKARYAAIRTDDGCEIEISGDSLRDLAQARIFWEQVRLTIPPEMVNGVVGDVMLVLPTGSTWSGTFGDLLRVLNTICADKLKELVKQVEELEKRGDQAAIEKAVDEVALQMTSSAQC